MSHFLQYFYLSWYPLNVFLVFYPGFLKNFDRNFLLGQNVLCHFDFSKSTFSQRFAYTG